MNKIDWVTLKTNESTDSLPKAKQLHIDLSVPSDQTAIELKSLDHQLLGLIAGDVLPPTSISSLIDLAKKATYQYKLDELLGKKHSFRVAQLGVTHRQSDSAMIVECICEHFKHRGIILVKKNNHRSLALPTGDHFVFDDRGIVLESNHKYYINQDILLCLSCHIEQDFAILTERSDGLIYVFESSIYEKSPKDPQTGENTFLDRDFFEWHSHIPHVGSSLVSIFSKMVNCFRYKQLDLLTIYLRGRNHYTHGTITVKRFEKDNVFPMFSQGKFFGLFAYCDVFFQDINATSHVYEGGQFLNITNPEDYYQSFTWNKRI